MISLEKEQVDLQERRKKFKFKNWPNSKLPQVAAGVYVIWHDDQLIYAGISGREMEKAIGHTICYSFC